MYRTGMQGAAAAAAAAEAAAAPSEATVSKAIGLQATERAESASSVQVGAAEGQRRLSSREEEQVLQLLEQQLLGQHTQQSSSTAAGDDSIVTAAAAADDDADWDVDELVALGLDAGILAWSQRLDFDSYQQHWSSTAVRLGSEALVPESERLQLLLLLQQQQQQQQQQLAV
jgi:hypothetical protein